MYNNPYTYNPMNNIDAQMQTLQNQRMIYNQSQQPTTPIINNINANGNISEMEARILGENETVDGIIISRKTLFIDEKNSKIYVKELNGDISKEYEILIPKDPKDIMIEKLMSKLEDMETRLNSYEHESTNVNANIKNEESTASNKSINRSKS